MGFSIINLHNFSSQSDHVRSWITREERNRIERDQRQQVSTSPAGESAGVSGAIKNLENRIRSSRSLQNLRDIESMTAEHVRSVRDITSGLGENVKRRYGSQMNVARGRYQHLPQADTDEMDYSLGLR